jgi:hypothetical protein
VRDKVPSSDVGARACSDFNSPNMDSVGGVRLDAFNMLAARAPYSLARTSRDHKRVFAGRSVCHSQMAASLGVTIRLA